jgi:Tol biopolymer transport system component
VWPNGTHVRQVTHVDGDAVNPDWSPDGRLIAFEWGTEEAARVAVMNADGSGLRTLPQTGSAGCPLGPPCLFVGGGRSATLVR